VAAQNWSWKRGPKIVPLLDFVAMLQFVFYRKILTEAFGLTGANSGGLSGLHVDLD
jgi:hypothetical protein